MRAIGDKHLPDGVASGKADKVTSQFSSLIIYLQRRRRITEIVHIQIKVRSRLRCATSEAEEHCGAEGERELNGSAAALQDDTHRRSCSLQRHPHWRNKQT